MPAVFNDQCAELLSQGLGGTVDLFISFREVQH